MYYSPPPFISYHCYISYQLIFTRGKRTAQYVNGITGSKYASSEAHNEIYGKKNHTKDTTIGPVNNVY